MYSNNDYRNYLMHYGVKGMKWKKRRSRVKNVTGKGKPIYKRAFTTYSIDEEGNMYSNKNDFREDAYRRGQQFATGNTYYDEDGELRYKMVNPALNKSVRKDFNKEQLDRTIRQVEAIKNALYNTPLQSKKKK